MSPIELLIEKFELAPHPEGGYFKETYRSKGSIALDALPQEYEGSRNFSTSIYFLLTSDTFSAFHKIKQDEIWHFYAGSPLMLYIISESGELSEHCIGNDFEAGEVPQLVVPGNHWFAAQTIEKDSYSFVGCTVAPGFDFADFVLPERKELLEKFPEHSKLIAKFTRTGEF
ncbi:cupin domain-containing protein [Flagellimonas myxillae]|uniref:cupin domain-containing protein n=1 Tax=Flagellimonas myxillae TaxID=2942214 RepID=UPI00201F99E5|nr:cupin domain-containing protein [Muricauda myxillae]MCL6267857.1 cupin domain-containing protein [Muricauda myxillae]